MLDLQTEVKFVKGVGPRIAEWLAQKNISTVEDLLYYLPFRYEDRLNPRGIGELRPGEMATVIAEVRNSAVFRTRSRSPGFLRPGRRNVLSLIARSTEETQLASLGAVSIFGARLTLSSSGLGHRPFTAVTRVRIPLGSLPSYKLRYMQFA